MLFFDLLYLLFLVLASPLWVIKVLPKKEYREILKHRFSPNLKNQGQNARDKKRLWIHAVSVGEVRSLKHLIASLKSWCHENQLEIILSVTTPSGYRCAREEFPEITVINAPLDFSFTIRHFIRKINPSMVVLNELEIWPNWVSILNRKNIPTLLINGRMSEPAFKRYYRFRLFLRPFFRKIGWFLLQSDFYRPRFNSLGIPDQRLSVCGNIKADQAHANLDQLPGKKEIIGKLKIDPADSRPVVTVASSHLHDEQLIAPVIKTLSADFLFIIVPRHLERVSTIEKLLEEHHIRHATWSCIKPDQATSETLIFDQMGYLFPVLSASDIVFMGGTLDPKTGGHNLYEPAVLGKPLIGGPHYNNFPEVGNELVEEGVYKIVTDSTQCIELLNGFNSGNINVERVGTRAKAVVDRARGSLECTLEKLKDIHGSIK